MRKRAEGGWGNNVKCIAMSVCVLGVIMLSGRGAENAGTKLNGPLRASSAGTVENVTEGDVFEDMVKWGKEGGVVNHLEIHEMVYKGGKNNKMSEKVRGTVAAVDIGKDDIIVSVPKSHVLSVEAMKKSELAFLFTDSITSKLAERMLLSVFILHQNNDKKSFWRPYTRFLNTVEMPMSTFYSDQKLSKQTKSLQAMTKRSLGTYKREYAQLFPYLSKTYPDTFGNEKSLKSGVYSFRRYKWARAIVWSRMWSLPMLDGSSHDFLVPFADMMNSFNNVFQTHADFVATKSHPEGAFLVKASEAIKKGGEVKFFYGRSCKEKMLVMYGFAHQGASPCSLRHKFGS